MLKKPLEDPGDLAKCPVCEFYFNKKEGFTCIKCKRGLLCNKHKVAGTKECASCVIERRHKELSDLKSQEMSLKSFLRLLLFIFLVFAMLFIALKIGLEDTVEFLKDSFIIEALPYIGGGAILGYIVFYFILSNQKAKTLELETLIRKMRLADK